jgi:two-component system OmpR family sensor kinase
LASRQSATREFTRFIRESQMDPPDDVVSQLADLYAQQGDWAGAEKVLGQISPAMTDQQRTYPLLLVDVEGNIVASNWMQLFNGRLLEQQLDQGWPVQVGEETVGTLIVPGRMPPPPGWPPDRLSPEGAATVQRVRQAILIAGFIAGAVALVIAGVLAWGLVRPLRRLTAAAEGIARGDLSQRVPVTSKDEVGELAATFNHMAAELERAEQLRRNMTADVAHELRTPLSVVRGKLEGMLDEVYPATPEHLQPVLEATELLTVLVEDLRLLAQAEAGQLALEKRAIDVGDLLRDAQVNFEPQASDRGVTLELDLPSDLPKVMADWHRIAQVLGNLLTNALRHTPEGGRVTLSAARVEGTVKVTVTDTGAGVPPEDLPYVFERFWRGEKSRSRVVGGSGLGLAIARQLVELHGGAIGVGSTPGKGSEFWFTL